MTDKNLYYPLWTKYLPVITVQMKNAVKGMKEVRMTKPEFDLHGNKKIADYIFDLEINNGKVSNNIRGKTVARDLYDTIQQNPSSKVLLENRHYKFSLGKDLVLKISVEGEPEQEQEQPVSETAS
jgi:hypothetical protein